MKLFGKPKPAVPQKDALQRLREAEDQLHKRNTYLEKKMNDELEKAKAYNKQGNKKAAVTCLKRKKMYEKQMETTNGALDTLLQQIGALESATFNQDTLKTMKAGADALKKANNNMTVQQVDDVMLDVQEQMEVNNEISEALTQGLGQQYDQDELLAELEELEQLELDEQLLNMESVPASRLPNVPTTTPKAKQKVQDDDEAELAALQASMM